MKKSYSIKGMHCASCVYVVEKALKRLSGVHDVHVNLATQKATLTSSQALDELLLAKTVSQTGYELIVPEMADHQAQSASTVDKTLVENTKISIILVIVSLIIMSTDIFLGDSHTIKELTHHVMPLLATYMLFVVGRPYLAGIVRFVRFKRADMDTLVGIGTLVAYVYSFILSAFEADLQKYIDTDHTYYEITVVVIGLITIGSFLEARAKAHTSSALQKLIGLQAQTARVVRGTEEFDIPIEDVLVGDIIRIRPGEKIPVDGTLIEGTLVVDESMITGESMPIDKAVGDFLIGATMNRSGSCMMQASKIGSDTMLAHIIKRVEDAQGSKAPIQRLADHISARFVPIVLVLAGITLVVWTLFGGENGFVYGLYNMIGVLIIACPCAMGLATPTAIMVGTGKAAEKGILIKDAESLETAHEVDTIIFDKTGTLTQGKPNVTDVVALAEYTKESVLTYAYSLEKHSEHPIAQAIVTFAQDQVGQKTHSDQVAQVASKKVTDFKALVGSGVEGTIDKVVYRIGNRRMLQSMKISTIPKDVEQLEQQGKTTLILVAGRKIIGIVAVADQIRSSARAAVAKLQAMGIETVIMSGDTKQTAHAIAQEVGIERVFAEVLPEDKEEYVNKLQKGGKKIAMVGDGINDAPALARADVGIAMGSGTDIAIESAHITLMRPDLEAVVQAIVISKRTIRTIRLSLFWAFAYNVALIPVAMGVMYPINGYMLNPMLASVAMSLSSLSVLGNALLLKRVRL